MNAAVNMTTVVVVTFLIVSLVSWLLEDRDD
jgi:hypothetical protein